jgi:hypothetical protein
MNFVLRIKSNLFTFGDSGKKHLTLRIENLKLSVEPNRHIRFAVSETPGSWSNPAFSLFYTAKT